MKTARRLALTATLCLPALTAGAFPLEFGRTRNPVIQHPRVPQVSGGFYDVNQDTAALFNDSPSQRFAVDGTIYFGILQGYTRERPVAGATAVSAAGLRVEFSLTPGDRVTAPASFAVGGGAAPEPGALALLAAAVSLAVTRFARRSR